MKKSVDDLDYRLLARFRYALRRFVAFSEQSARKVGLTPKQHQALLVVRGFSNAAHAITIGELAERLLIKHHSTVELVDRMERQGLVERTSVAGDRRHVHVCLTRHGTEMLESLTAVHKAEIEQIGPELLTILREMEKPGGNEKG